MKESSKKTKICHGCQAELPVTSGKCPYCGEHQQTRFELFLERVIDTVSPHHVPTTMFLIVSMVIYFVVISVDIILHPAYGFLNALMAPPGELVYHWGAHLRGEHVWWRLVTANFVHFGIIHIIFNMYALRMVCPYVERTFGSAQTLFSFVVLGTGSMLCSNILGGSGLVAGASGGLMAFIGMAAVGAHLEHTQFSLHVRNGMLKWAVATILFGFMLSMSDSIGVDNIAHISGFILGMLAGFILPKQSTTGFTRLWMIRTTRFAAIMAFLVIVISFVQMGMARESLKFQNECVANLKLKQFDRAQIECFRAYQANKNEMMSYHNYIQINLINGHVDEASRLCVEGRHRFSRQFEHRPVSFDEMCRSINK